ncbi:MAG: SDR family oxidoreductase [Pseudonocardiaceae bacterium]|nr:SDR family oxidoreductase [Pseudonocardiaceae bacterium]
MATTERVSTPDGVTLAVRRYGDPAAPTVVCVHGYPDNASVWDNVVPLLAKRYHVVTYDVRGAGESDRPRDRAAYRLDVLVEDLNAVLDAVSPDRPVHLLGHDWGSIQCWHGVTGERLGGRVASFTSISGPCLDHVGAWMRSRLRPNIRSLRELTRQLASSVYIGFFLIPLLPELAWRLGIVGRILERLNRAENGPGASQADTSPRLADAVSGLRLYRANMLSRLGGPERRRTDVPVQVLAPDRDRFVTAPLQADVGRWAQDVRVRRMRGGHWLPRSRPAAVAGCVDELVEHVTGGPESRSLRRSRVTGSRRAGRFADQLVVVTGAGSGIGRATALAFAAHGADVLAVDIDADTAERTAALARQFTVDAASYAVDVSDAAAMADFAERVRAAHGVPDVVVNNAGVAVAGSFVDTTVSDWERVVDVNLWGVIHGTREFAAQMLDRAEGGRIVNVASAAAYLPSRNLAAYSATKAAVHQLSECVRGELASSGIGVITVCPGVVNTNITRTTRFVGLDGTAEDASRVNAVRAYQRRNFSPDRVAREILNAVQHNTALVPVTPEAKVALVLSRLTPGVLRAGAKLDLRPR